MAPVRRLTFGPVFLQRTNASTLLQALDDTLPSLSLQALIDLTLTVPLVVLSLCGDLASGNVRLVHFVAHVFQKRLRANLHW